MLWTKSDGENGSVSCYFIARDEGLEGLARDGSEVRGMGRSAAAPHRSSGAGRRAVGGANGELSCGGATFRADPLRCRGTGERRGVVGVKQRQAMEGQQRQHHAEAARRDEVPISGRGWRAELRRCSYRGWPAAVPWHREADRRGGSEAAASRGGSPVPATGRRKRRARLRG
ncbi:unnamed protein product [Urochloa humidicola]